MNRNTENGFLTVEAAIFLPIFIIGVLTFAYLIKFLSVQERVFHSFADETRILIAESAYNPMSASLFALTLKVRLHQENGDDISEPDVDCFPHLLPENGTTDITSLDLNYHVNVRLPIPFRKRLPVSESILYRGFTGVEVASDPLPFEEMEKETDSNLVWVFPRSGERYHADHCIHIRSEPRQRIMSYPVRKNYKPCSICNSHDLADGSLVYCFQYGEAFHAGDCPIVEKYVIAIEKEEAEKRGYHPCTKCGGN